MYLLCSDWSIRCLEEEEEDEKEKENCHLLITAVVPTGAVIKICSVRHYVRHYLPKIKYMFSEKYVING